MSRRRRHRHPADKPHVIALDDRERLGGLRWLKAGVGDVLDELVDPRSGGGFGAHDLAYPVDDALLPPRVQSLQESLLLLDAEVCAVVYDKVCDLAEAERQAARWFDLV